MWVDNGIQKHSHFQDPTVIQTKVVLVRSSLYSFFLIIGNFQKLSLGSVRYMGLILVM